RSDPMTLDYLYLEVTRRCNQKCVQCFNNSGLALENEMSADQLKEVITKFAEQGGKKLQITGGDPLTKRGIKSVVERIKECDFSHTVLSTNGMLIDDRWASVIEEVFDEIDISLDGFAEQHNVLRGVVSFERTIEALRKLSKKNITKYVCCCLT